MANHLSRTSAQSSNYQPAFDAGRKRTTRWFARHGITPAVHRDLLRAEYIQGLQAPGGSAAMLNVENRVAQLAPREKLDSPHPSDADVSHELVEQDGSCELWRSTLRREGFPDFCEWSMKRDGRWYRWVGEE
jgi:hypothetical protein